MLDRTRAAVAALTAIVVTAAPAQAQLKPEETLKMRQGVMIGQKSQLGPMGAVAKGEQPMSDQTATQAENLVALARLAVTTFGPETKDLKPTKAKPDIWQKQQEFEKAGLGLIAETEKLATLAKAKDESGFKTQFQAVAKACKTCHDSFRSE